MIRFKRNILKLNRLILFTALTATVITFINSFYSNYQVQKELLILQSIEVNRSYAKKLSETTEVFLTASLQQLDFSVTNIFDKMKDEKHLEKEVNRLKYQTDSFNSVIISDKDGIAKAASREISNLVGKKLTLKEGLAPLKTQKTMISTPYVSSLDNLLVIMSVPIYDLENNYLGFLGGTIYLKEDNVLQKILGTHYYKNGSYIYVVDKNKQILYHPNKSRIGGFVKNSTGIDEIMKEKEGGVLLTNQSGDQMLAGYARVPSTDWVVITQSPLDASLLPLTGIMEKVIVRGLPIGLAVFLFIWLFTLAISFPLKQLAEKAQNLDSPDVIDEIKKINAWYVESQSLKKAILKGVSVLYSQIGQLQHDVKTDPLTGANNRRAFELKLKKLFLLEIPFSILALDIDFFKKINDNYGHSTGDDVLKRLVQIMNQLTKGDDMVARTGGEEFTLLLNNMSLDKAKLFAEMLRITISKEYFETVGNITVSIGIASWTNELITIDETLSLADNALYEAKDLGRNRCVVTS